MSIYEFQPVHPTSILTSSSYLHITVNAIATYMKKIMAVSTQIAKPMDHSTKSSLFTAQSFPPVTRRNDTGGATWLLSMNVFPRRRRGILYWEKAIPPIAMLRLTAVRTSDIHNSSLPHIHQAIHNVFLIACLDFATMSNRLDSA
jgi:hypothetical protein